MREIIYGLYVDGELVYKGTRYDLNRDGLCMFTSNITPYVNKHYKLKGKYDVRKIGVYEHKAHYRNNKGYYKPKQEDKKEQTELEYIVEHLKIYGNTVTRNNPEQLIPELNELGFNVVVTPYVNYKENGSRWFSDYLIEIAK